MRVPTVAPHRFFLTLDVDEYFATEDDPEEIAQFGLVRGLNLAGRSVLAVIRFNEDWNAPAFEVTLPGQDPPTPAEEVELGRLVGRIVGSNVDVAGFQQKVADDPMMAPIVARHLGFKRLARSCFFEDALRHIIRTRISHEPTRQRMVHDVRRAWGTAFEWRQKTYYSFPRPEVLAGVAPADFRAFGISERKGEYVVGLAKLIASGELDQWALEQASAQEFWDAVVAVRGIGPSTAQALMFRRNRSDGDVIVPRSAARKGEGNLTSYRYWILTAYGLDPHKASDEDFLAIRERWRGFEALAWHYLFYNWLMEEKEAGHSTRGA